VVLVSENINLFNDSARTLQTDRQTDRQDYYGNTALCTNVHRAVKTRSNRTVHTSAKARLSSVAKRIRIRIQFCIRISDLDRHQNLIICSVAHCQPSLKISCKSVWKFFFVKLLTDRQTDRQTNNDDYITSLTEVIKREMHSAAHSGRQTRDGLLFPCTNFEVCVKLQATLVIR